MIHELFQCLIWIVEGNQLQKKLAEGVGFEPTLRFPVNTLSKRAPSATRPPLRIGSRNGARLLYINKCARTPPDFAPGEYLRLPGPAFCSTESERRRHYSGHPKAGTDP